ncbi:hypothetical protein FKM82_007843 [Ascaphus truei]
MVKKNKQNWSWTTAIAYSTNRRYKCLRGFHSKGFLYPLLRGNGMEASGRHGVKMVSWAGVYDIDIHDLSWQERLTKTDRCPVRISEVWIHNLLGKSGGEMQRSNWLGLSEQPRYKSCVCSRIKETGPKVTPTARS